jgi:hypothetical protein
VNRRCVRLLAMVGVTALASAGIAATAGPIAQSPCWTNSAACRQQGLAGGCARSDALIDRARCLGREAVH